MASSQLARSNISDLSNKIALITGAASGIGRAIAKSYADAGAYVIVADITPNPPKTPILEETTKWRNIDLNTPTVELLNSNWPGHSKDRCKYVKCDVTQADNVAAAVKYTADAYGRLDILVNNAGVMLEIANGTPTPLHETDDALFDKTMAINTRGTWLGVKHAIIQMLAQEPHPSGDRGWIINISSIAGLVGFPMIAPYSTSKAAVTNLTRVAALEYASQNIHVNSIHPGYCNTPLLDAIRTVASQNQARERLEMTWESRHPWGRLAWPEDIAKMAVFLAGDGASFVTGQQFVVDGGYTAQ